MSVAPFSAGPPVAEMDLVSFDGGVRARQPVARLDRYRQIECLPPRQTRIVRGAGYSYAAAGFGGPGIVQDVRLFDRVLGLDEESGIIECEAGVTLGKIHQVAAPRGLFLPVQPGYPLITVGGCLAGDVHGKNQYRDGTFRRVVRSLRLFHPRHGVVEADDRNNRELLELTCGGLGLTGHVLSMKLQLERLPGSRMLLRRIAVPRLEDTLALLEEHARAEFLYTWHDLTHPGDTRGRGYLYVGGFVAGSPPDRDGGGRVRHVDAAGREAYKLAFLNRATTRAFNAAYSAWQAAQPAVREESLFSFLFPVAEKVLYFKLFGRRGFHEYQMVVPRAAFAELCRQLRRSLDAAAVPVTLASCKLFGGERSLLRFDGGGLCLALDFPRTDAGAEFARVLDRVACELGGLPNVMKDSRLPLAVVRSCHAGYDEFRQRLHRFDPDRLYRSELSERLEL